MTNRIVPIMGVAFLVASLVGLGAQAASGTGDPWSGRPGHMFDSGHMFDDGHMFDSGHMDWGWGRAQMEGTAEAIDGAAEIVVTATDFAFSPATLEFEVGKPVNLTLVNDGTVPHDLVIPGLNVHVAATPGEQATVGVVPETTGTFDALCTYPGHASAGMTATVNVRTGS